MTTSSITYTNYAPLSMRATVVPGSELPKIEPSETFSTGSCDNPVFRMDTSNLHYRVDGLQDPIQLQIRFPDEKSHFTAWYDDKAQQIVVPNKPPVQDPEDFLIAM